VQIRVNGVWHQVNASVPPLGIFAQIDPIPHTTKVAKGDLMLVYSDGFSELETPNGLWGGQGIIDAIPPTFVDPYSVVGAILAAAELLMESTPLQHADDQTILCIAVQ
jgi:serine phosphatase RsbU (regulator of sigma subunit)